MSSSDKKLPLDGCANLVKKLTDDFYTSAENSYRMPNKKTYKVESSPEPLGIVRSARVAALDTIENHRLIKTAFDTRRINQEGERNPRSNLQYWNRSQQFVEQRDKDRLNAFAKLLIPLDIIKDNYGEHPEYFQSYARSLRDSIKRVMKVDDGDVDVFSPQLDYLEQLLYARYRLSLADITKVSNDCLITCIMKRDENLTRRDAYLKATDGNARGSVFRASEGLEKNTSSNSKEVGGVTQESLVNAIFGNSAFRRDGEDKVERTITITITDNVLK